VPGVGEKTAAALIRAFGSVGAIIAALDAGHGGFPPGSRAKLAAARDYLEVAPAVVRTATDVPLPQPGGRLPMELADPARLTELGAKWGLGSSLARFVSAITAS
jgi:5'-3' exonuclease